MVDNNSSNRKLAIDRLVELTPLDVKQAEELVDVALQASANQTLETIMGFGSVPTTLTLTRVEMLKTICLQIKRPLSQLEIQVLFRTTPSSAKLILTNMSSTYAQALRADFLSQMTDDAAVIPTGINGALKWQVKFGQEASFETARRELDKFNLLRFATCKRSLRYVEFPQAANPAAEGNDLLSILKLPVPTTAPAPAPTPTTARGRRSGRR